MRKYAGKKFIEKKYLNKDEPEPLLESYLEREREDGEGEHRVGEFLTFREDMYNLCFISQVRRIYKEKCEAFA